MINLAREVIKYYLKGKRRHGVHSPFVYDFGDNCLSLPLPENIQQEFQALKKSFLQSKDKIKVTDLGAGSKKLNQEREVRRIARISGINRKYGALLYRLVRHYDCKNVLELGTSLGLGTYMLVSGKDNVKVTTIEGCPTTAAYAEKCFPKELKERTQFIVSSFEDYLQNEEEKPIFDLVFIDGDHQSKHLYRQLELLEEHTHNNTLFVLDDIRWSKDMLGAWNTLIKDETHHLTMDLFRMGIIAKRPQQRKEHFVIRY